MDGVNIALRCAQVTLYFLVAVRLGGALTYYWAQKRSGIGIIRAPMDIRYSMASILIMAVAVSVFYAPENLIRLSRYPHPAWLPDLWLLIANLLNASAAIVALTGMCAAYGQERPWRAAFAYSMPLWAWIAVALELGW